MPSFFKNEVLMQWMVGCLTPTSCPLRSDGLFEVLSNQQAVEAALAAMQSTGGSKASGALCAVVREGQQFWAGCCYGGAGGGRNASPFTEAARYPCSPSLTSPHL